MVGNKGQLPNSSGKGYKLEFQTPADSALNPIPMHFTRSSPQLSSAKETPALSPLGSQRVSGKCLFCLLSQELGFGREVSFDKPISHLPVLQSPNSVQIHAKHPLDSEEIKSEMGHLFQLCSLNRGFPLGGGWISLLSAYLQGALQSPLPQTQAWHLCTLISEMLPWLQTGIILKDLCPLISISLQPP